MGSITGQHAHFFGASLMAQMVKNLPAVWKTQVRSLGGEDPLDSGADSPILPRRLHSSAGPIFPSWVGPAEALLRRLFWTPGCSSAQLGA